MKKLVSLCVLGDLPQGKPRLLRAEGRRLACVRRGTRVDVVDDRCPHEGHPLSMGLVRDGVLTCPWHNWKFDLGTGRCLFGGEAVRRYPVELVGEEVFVDLALDPAEAELQLEEDLVRAVADGAVDGALREGLRLARVANDPRAPFAPLVRMAASRPPFGAGDALVAADAALALARAGVLDDAEALAVAAQAVADEVRSRPARPLPRATPAQLADRDAFLEDLLEERRAEAVARVLGLPPSVGVAEVADAWLVPFASLKLWDRGTSLARVRAGAGLAAELGERVREDVLAGLATSLGWAVAESDLPAWRATRAGLHDAARLAPGTEPLGDAAAAELRRAALQTEREAIDATLAHARRGADPRALLEALATASLERLASYDLARSIRAGSTVTAWEPARAVLLAHAATRAPAPRFALTHAVMLAGLLGRLGRVSLPGHDALGASDDVALREAARDAALAPRCPWSDRGRAAALAAACLALCARDPSRVPLATRALVRATREDLGAGLARIAATARRLVEGAEPDED